MAAVKTNPRDNRTPRSGRGVARYRVEPPQAPPTLPTGPRVLVDSTDLQRPEFAERIKELVRLAQEQGNLTHNDLIEAFPGADLTPAALDEIYMRLQNLEVAIVDAAEIERVRPASGAAEEEERGRLDVLVDPVRMYLKQMGQVPL